MLTLSLRLTGELTRVSVLAQSERRDLCRLPLSDSCDSAISTQPSNMRVLTRVAFNTEQ